MFSGKAETLQTERAVSRAWLSYKQHFFPCHCIDLIKMIDTLKLCIASCSSVLGSSGASVHDFKGAAFNFNEHGQSSWNIYYCIEGMNYGLGLQRVCAKCTWSDHQAFTIRCTFDHDFTGGRDNTKSSRTSISTSSFCDLLSWPE